MPRTALSGQNPRGTRSCASVPSSATQAHVPPASTQPSEWMRNRSTSLVPIWKAQFVRPTYIQSSAAPKASQTEQTTALDGAEKSNCSPVPTPASTNPRRKSSASSVRVVFVEVMGVTQSHSSVTGGPPRLPSPGGLTLATTNMTRENMARNARPTTDCALKTSQTFRTGLMPFSCMIATIHATTDSAPNETRKNIQSFSSITSPDEDESVVVSDLADKPLCRDAKPTPRHAHEIPLGTV